MDEQLYAEIGRRIRHAREELSFSQEELASSMGYSSAATISQFETGRRKISVIDLHRLSQILGVPLDYLYGSAELSSQTVMLRAEVAEVLPADRPNVAAYISFARQNGREPIDLPQNLRDFPPGYHYGVYQQAAEDLLEFLNVTDIPIPVRSMARDLNIPVFDWDFPDEVSGIVIMEEGSFCIGVNQNHPYVRQRFTIAHEIGHFLFHQHVRMYVDFIGAESASNQEDYDKERQANFFAVDLLMPEKWVRREFEEYGVDRLPLLAQKFEVSQQAMWFRLLNLELVIGR